MAEEQNTEKLSLVEASYHGKLSTVRYLVRNLPPSSLNNVTVVKKIGSSGGDLHNCTALHVACIRGYVDIARTLLEAGASIEIRDCTGSTPFSEAVYHNQLDLVEILAQFGANINSVNSFGWTPIHVAAFQGKLDIVRKLVDLGADITRETPEGYSTVHIATLTGKSPVVAYLLDKGATVSFINASSSQRPHTPLALFLAIAGHFKGLVNKFLRHPDCPLSVKADAMMLMGAVNVLDTRFSQAKTKWLNALQLREDHSISFSPSPSIGCGNRCEIANLTQLNALCERDDVEIEAAFQLVIIWERCMGTVDQRYWVSLQHLIGKLVFAKRFMEAGEVIFQGLKTIETSQLPLLEKGCILPQNFEVFFGDTLLNMVCPQLADHTVTFEMVFPYVFKVLDLLISRGASLYTSFGCPNFVPKFLLGVILKMIELWLMTELAPCEYESREEFGHSFVSNYLYLSDSSNLLFIALQSPCQNQAKLLEALLSWGGREAINSVYRGQRLFQRAVSVEVKSQEQASIVSPLLRLLVDYGVHGDAVDHSGKSAIDYCPKLFGPACPLPLVCLAARRIVKESLPYHDMPGVAPRLKKFIMMHDIQTHTNCDYQ